MKNISIESFSTLALTRAGPEYLSKTGTDGSILNGEQQTGTFMTVSSMAPRAVDSIPIYLSTAYCGRHGPGAHATVDVDSTLTGRGPMLRSTMDSMLTGRGPMLQANATRTGLSRSPKWRRRRRPLPRNQ